jgi:hypothetical protein
VSLVRTEAAIEAWSFARAAMSDLGRTHAKAFREAQPWPHVVIDGLLGDELSTRIARAFPRASHPGWKQRDYADQVRLALRPGLDDIAPELRHFLGELCAMPFLDFLGALLGRRDLIADPQFTGAGPMATLPGGHLAVHADFNRDSARHLDRVASVLYYAPIAWQAGGELELWDRARTTCVAQIAPLRDRLVVLAYGEDHWHGHPSPLVGPDMRAVIASTYYAARVRDGDDDTAHGAIW